MIENTITRENGFTMNRVTCSCDLRNSLFAVVSLLVTLLLIYGNSFFGEWHFDDFNNIVDNRNVHVKGLSWQEIQKTFYGVSDGSEGQRISRPLSYLSFGLNYFFGGTEVFGYHVVNFVIHFTSVFLFLFITKHAQLPLLRDRYGEMAYGIALLATFFWATSPLQVNAVTIIVQRMTCLAGLVTVMALYFYVRARRMAAGWAEGSLSLSLFSVAPWRLSDRRKMQPMLPISILLYDVLLIQGATRENLSD